MKTGMTTLLSLSLAVGFGLLARGGEGLEAGITQYEWSTTDLITRPNVTGTITEADCLNGVTAYLVDADFMKESGIVMNQQAVLTGVLADGLSIEEVLGGAKLSAVTVQNGVVPTGTSFVQPSQGTAGHGYFVLSATIDDENLLYISGYSTIEAADQVGVGTLVLNPASSHGDILRTTTFRGGMTAGDGGGWYAVPEPTGGLLVALGLAALALRRRRAR